MYLISTRSYIIKTDSLLSTLPLKASNASIPQRKRLIMLFYIIERIKSTKIFVDTMTTATKIFFSNRLSLLRNSFLFPRDLPYYVCSKVLAGWWKPFFKDMKEWEINSFRELFSKHWHNFSHWANLWIAIEIVLYMVILGLT